MVVWLKPCESRSSPGSYPQTPRQTWRGVCFCALGKMRRWRQAEVSRSTANCHRVRRSGATGRMSRPCAPRGTPNWSTRAATRDDGQSAWAAACSSCLTGRSEATSSFWKRIHPGATRTGPRRGLQASWASCTLSQDQAARRTPTRASRADAAEAGASRGGIRPRP